jgi:hypothetical protein
MSKPSLNRIELWRFFLAVPNSDNNEAHSNRHRCSKCQCTLLDDILDDEMTLRHDHPTVHEAIDCSKMLSYPLPCLFLVTKEEKKNTNDHLSDVVPGREQHWTTGNQKIVVFNCPQHFITTKKKRKFTN